MFYSEARIYISYSGLCIYICSPQRPVYTSVVILRGLYISVCHTHRRLYINICPPQRPVCIYICSTQRPVYTSGVILRGLHIYVCHTQKPVFIYVFYSEACIYTFSYYYIILLYHTMYHTAIQSHARTHLCRPHLRPFRGANPLN
jgi:hypothetical protein